MSDDDVDALDAVIFPGGVPSRRALVERGAPPPETPASIELAWDNNPQHRFEKYLHGEKVEVFTVGALAEALGVSTKAIYKWERQRVLPPSRYRAPEPQGKLPGKVPAGRRFYTRAHIEAVVEAAREAHVPYRPKQPRPDWKLFTALVVRSWKALG